MACPKCKSDYCVGFILLHPIEVKDVGRIKQELLKENPDNKFKLIRSTDRDGNPDGLFTKFMELHIICDGR